MEESVPSTTASSSSSGGSISFNSEYLKTANGIFAICEIALGLLCWSLTASTTLAGTGAAHGFVLFVSITSWLTTLIIFGIFVTNLNNTSCGNTPWAIIHLVHNAGWSPMYFIAFCVSAAFAGIRTALQAATAFAFFTALLYIVHAIFCFRDWKGEYPWSAMRGSTVPS